MSGWNFGPSGASEQRQICANVAAKRVLLVIEPRHHRAFGLVRQSGHIDRQVLVVRAEFADRQMDDPPCRRDKAVAPVLSELLDGRPPLVN